LSYLTGALIGILGASAKIAPMWLTLSHMIPTIIRTPRPTTHVAMNQARRVSGRAGPAFVIAKWVGGPG
ncbi:MAG: hypothetical protein ABIZ83_03530, partial [Casimicrobium sp.]